MSRSVKKGRILIRASGTEPLIRIMLEGEDRKRISDMAENPETFFAHREVCNPYYDSVPAAVFSCCSMIPHL